MEGKFNLQRFIAAQAESMDSALRELGRGKKTGHWMWYIFPQIKGLGQSPVSVRYAIQSEDEALAYLHHPVLGPRLFACTQAVNAHDNLTAEQIFGYPDYLKFRSCMTLFAKVSGKQSPFSVALDKFFAGEPDLLTNSILQTL